MIKAEDFKWLDRVNHLFHLGSYLCLPGALTDCFLPLFPLHRGDYIGEIDCIHGICLALIILLYSIGADDRGLITDVYSIYAPGLRGYPIIPSQYFT